MRSTQLIRALVALALLWPAPALADDARVAARKFFGIAALASVQPERVASRRDLRGVPEETKPGGLLSGGVTIARRFALQGEVSATGRLEKRDRDDDSRDRWVDRRDALASAVFVWRAVTAGRVALEPVGGVTIAFARDRRFEDDDDEDEDDDRTRDDITRAGVVAGLDVSIHVVRRFSIVPTFRAHRLARRTRGDDEDRFRLRDGANVYRFGIGARWTF
jgi:hypothetical protein